ncbi:MAG: hypothetical protein WBW74_05470 [Xanthobacteraceae bacterium]
MMMRIFTFGLAVAMAMATLPSAGRAGPNSQGGLAAPFSPGATIYRPDCWIKEDPTSRWDVGTGCIGE